MHVWGRTFDDSRNDESSSAALASNLTTCAPSRWRSFNARCVCENFADVLLHVYDMPIADSSDPGAVSIWNKKHNVASILTPTSIRHKTSTWGTFGCLEGITNISLRNSHQSDLPQRIWMCSPGRANSFGLMSALNNFDKTDNQYPYMVHKNKVQSLLTCI